MSRTVFCLIFGPRISNAANDVRVAPPPIGGPSLAEEVDQHLSSFDVVIRIEASSAMDANGSALTLDKRTKDYCLAV